MHWSERYGFHPSWGRVTIGCLPEKKIGMALTVPDDDYRWCRFADGLKLGAICSFEGRLNWVDSGDAIKLIRFASKVSTCWILSSVPRCPPLIDRLFIPLIVDSQPFSLISAVHYFVTLEGVTLTITTLELNIATDVRSRLLPASRDNQSFFLDSVEYCSGECGTIRQWPQNCSQWQIILWLRMTKRVISVETREFTIFRTKCHSCRPRHGFRWTAVNGTKYYIIPPC